MINNKKTKKTKMVIDINLTNLHEVLKESETVIQFSANWCGPCKTLTPRVVQISEDNSDVVIGKVDVEQESEIAKMFNIRSIPVMIYFKNGDEVERVIGASNVSEIQSKIDNLKN